MAGLDCGFSVHVGMAGIDPDFAWAKLEARAEGCELPAERVVRCSCAASRRKA